MRWWRGWGVLAPVPLSWKKVHTYTEYVSHALALLILFSFFPLFIFTWVFHLFWDVIDIRHCVCLRCIAWWIHTGVHCKMVTTVKLVNAFITYLVISCECVVRNVKINSLSPFQVSTQYCSLLLLCCMLGPRKLFISKLEVCTLNNLHPFLHPSPLPLAPPSLLSISMSSVFLKFCIW